MGHDVRTEAERRNPLRRLMPLAFVALAACQQDLALDLTTSALDPAHPQPVAATLVLDTGSRDKCAEHGRAIAEALAKGLDALSFLGCSEMGMNTVARFTFTIPVLTGTAADVKPTTALYILTADVPVLGRTVALKRNQDRVDTIIQAMPSAVQSNAEDFAPAITTQLRNDGTKPVTLTIAGVFVNGDPHQLAANVALTPGQMVEIRLSDVGNAAFRGDGAMIAAYRPN